MGPQPPRETSARETLRVRARVSGAKRGGPPKRGPARSKLSTRGEAPSELQRMFARRLRACRSLGIPVPKDAASGPPETLLQRVALLDRRIEVSLDLAGGRQFPPWEDPDDEELPPDDDEGEVAETSS